MVLSLINSSFAQDSTKTYSLSLSGSADVYYKYDFGQSKTNNLTSFTNSHNSFELGMALLSFGCVLMLKLPPGDRVKAFEKIDFLTFSLFAPGVACLCAVTLTVMKVIKG